MHYLNRIYLIGYLAENPNVFLKGNNERVATLCLHIPMDGSSHTYKYNVYIDDVLMVEYADSCLTAGDLVFVEGRLEPMVSNSDLSQQNWIVISENQGLLHPVYSSAQVLQKV